MIGLIVSLFWFAICLCIYFLPSIVAFSGKKIHKNATAVLVVNFFLGWTLIGWVVALVMAVWNRE